METLDSFWGHLKKILAFLFYFADIWKIPNIFNTTLVKALNLHTGHTIKKIEIRREI